MLSSRKGSALLRILAIAVMVAGVTGTSPARAAAPLFSEVHTIAAPTTGVPQEFNFDVSVAGTYTVTLTDLGASLTPAAPLASVKLAVSGGTALVGAPLVGAGTLTLDNLAVGTYVLHVVGMPGSVPGSGPFGIQVNGPAMSHFAFQGSLALPSQGLPSSEGVLDHSFTVSTSGSYTVSLTDLQLPQSLSTMTALLIAEGGATPLAILSNTTTLTANVTLAAGTTYDLFAVGQAGSTVNAGLFSAVVTASGGGPIAYGTAVPVGSTMLVGTPALKAGSATFALTDVQYPAALSQVAAVLTLYGQPVAPALTASGSEQFTATVNTYAAYAVGIPAASPGEGAYAVGLTEGGVTALSAARAVTAAGSAVSAFSFDASLPSSGSQAVTLADFQFPAALASVKLAVAQGGKILGTLGSPMSLNVNAASGPLSLLVFAQQSGSAGGLFGVDLAPGAGGASEFDATQGVGALFVSQPISIVNAGNYSVTATDLGFPASFASYDTVVTQGATQVGSIFGGGTFVFNATAGNYTVNFIAQPMGSDQAGTYALSVSSAPAAPVVNLTVDHSQVSSGSTVNLVWSSQNATSCTASGGWSGTKPLSGSTTSAALTSNTTFTLSCTGPGGTSSKSVPVTVSAASSGGGGGALDAVLLLLLTMLCASRAMLPVVIRSSRTLPTVSAQRSQR